MQCREACKNSITFEQDIVIHDVDVLPHKNHKQNYRMPKHSVLVVWRDSDKYQTATRLPNLDATMQLARSANMTFLRLTWNTFDVQDSSWLDLHLCQIYQQFVQEEEPY